VVDEEAGGFGSIDLIKRRRLAKAIIVTEPTWNTLQPAEGGLDWVRVTFAVAARTRDGATTTSILSMMDRTDVCPA
jgi:hypothetical protein